MVCCKRFRLESNGLAQNTQKSRFGWYIPSSPARINNHDSYKLKEGHASIMYHSRFGWRVYIGIPNNPDKSSTDKIRFKCKSTCIDSCFQKNKNESIKFYDNKDPNVEWYKDDTIKATCQDAENISRGAIIGGIVAGATFLFILVAILIACICKRKNRGRTRSKNVQRYEPQKISLSSISPNPYYVEADGSNTSGDAVVPLSIRSSSKNQFDDKKGDSKTSDNTGKKEEFEMKSMSNNLPKNHNPHGEVCTCKSYMGTCIYRTESKTTSGNDLGVYENDDND